MCQNDDIYNATMSDDEEVVAVVEAVVVSVLFAFYHNHGHC